MGENWKRFIKHLVGMPPRQLLVNFIKKYSPSKEALFVDIGSGSGNETVYLLENWYKVIAIDGEKLSEKVIIPRISSDQKNRFEFRQQKLEDLQLPEKADVIYSFYTLQFCNPENFDATVKTIQDSIVSSWFFVGNFLWIHDDRKHLVVKTLKEVKNMFSEFTILSIEEKEYDRKGTVLPILKHRHEIEIIAQKK